VTLPLPNLKLWSQILRVVRLRSPLRRCAPCCGAGNRTQTGRLWAFRAALHYPARLFL